MRMLSVILTAMSGSSSYFRTWLGWARFNVPLDTFLGHFRDGGETAASARIVAAVRANSVCGVE